MAQFGFGAGTAIAVDSGANPTPLDFNALQEWGVSFSASTKEMFGAKQFALAVARGTAKITSKLKFGVLDGRIFNTLMFGGTMSTGQTVLNIDVATTIPATPFQITAAPATGFADLGVEDVTTGLRMVRVASAPATGQYTVTAVGLYTYAAADTGKAIRYSFSNTQTTSGNSVALSNPLLGTSSFFKLVLSAAQGGLRNTTILNANQANKLDFGTKIEDFMMPEMEASAFADSSDNIGIYTQAEAT